ncbi:hypothetical protein [Pseudoalteromonas sp. ZZD1]|uniref:hypothetical protein n=1 Tax=Pseudoalteromonas sp. ZZD1 TaxID=3139395 RepID=UPI003BAAEA43
MLSLERLQDDYEQEFKALYESLNNLAISISEKQKKPVSSTLAKQECGKVCLECKHGKYSNYKISTDEEHWKFSCLMDHSQKRSVEECTHYEPTINPNIK